MSKHMGIIYKNQPLFLRGLPLDGVVSCFMGSNLRAATHEGLPMISSKGIISSLEFTFFESTNKED